MISLKSLFKRNTLNDQGARLSRIITAHLVNSDEQCLVDFGGVSTISSLFFQDFIFPLVIEFSGKTITKRLKLINLSDEHVACYQLAFEKSSEYLDRVAARQTRPFGDISDLTFELLIKVRELSTHDPLDAQVIFGIDNGMIESFANMDIEQIRRVSSAGIICFGPRFSPEYAAKLASMEAFEIDAFLNVVGDLEIEGIYESEYH